ncbi:hypothetical protein KY284_000830 [Solanum tuberosum]|nr:hypothetical protein KY284_000830 [Solanum tuberosum]
MFGDQGQSAKQTAMRTLMNTKMVEGTPVRDHVMKMIGFLNELEVLRAEIDNDSQGAETFVKKAPSMALNVEKGSTSKPQGGQKKKKAHKAKAIAPPTGGVKKSKGKCFHCKMSGH